MRLGIPRGFFYYDYISFMRQLFRNTGVQLLVGDENDERVLMLGSEKTVDECCMPVKLLAGQIRDLQPRCDKVLIPRVMKDSRGRWLCPKLLGIPELTTVGLCEETYIVTDALYFHEKRRLRKALWNLCRQLGVPAKTFTDNFQQAYNRQQSIAVGKRSAHVEAAWEFVPEPPKEGEIILPNLGSVLVTGHCYNVYDKFVNGDIMKKLDELGISAITDKKVSQAQREAVMRKSNLIKKPFWEAFVRIIGGAVCMLEKVEGVIYLSSFSCGLDAFIIEMLKTHMDEKPLMVLKLDEHRGEAGFETRLEAFADLLEKRRFA